MSGFAAQIGQDGSIHSLEQAAEWRWSEAALLEEAGRRAAALYWCGFTVEIRLTAALLRLTGYGPSEPVSLGAIDRLRKEARRQKLMTSEPHDLVGLGRYLLHRRGTLGMKTTREIALNLTAATEGIYEHWRPRLRYKTLVPTPLQLREAQTAAIWVTQNYNRLWS